MPDYTSVRDPLGSPALQVRPASAQAGVVDGLPQLFRAPPRNDRTTRLNFSNPIARGADPWVVHHAGFYYFCEPVTDNSIAIWKSDCFTRRGARQMVWKAPRHGWNSHLIWAPELHRLDRKWYIYYAASAAPHDNASHRVGVLECITEDPVGPYFDRGMLYTGDDPLCRCANRWAIDATVLELRGKRYLIWSGWPAGADLQYLYIAPLENPWTTAGRRVRLCDNATHDWERINDDPRERGLHEAPQVLKHDGRVFVTYSCSASWLETYKLGLLELTGANPLDPSAWRKYPQPVFRGSQEIFGVGHASFVKSPDGLEDWVVYHSKTSRAPGWRRVVCTQRFGWRADGLPEFGQPASWRVPLSLPSGAVPTGVLLDQAGQGFVSPPRPNRCPRLQRADSPRPNVGEVRYAWRFGQCPCEAPVSFTEAAVPRDCRLCRAASTSA